MGWGWEAQWTVYEKTQFRNVTHRGTRSRHTLPSPCAVFPPLHPDCSPARPQRRWCWWTLVDCSASPLAQQSDIQETHSPPQNNGPKGHTDRLNRWILYVHIYRLTASFTKNKRHDTAEGKIKCWCVIGSSLSSPVQWTRPGGHWGRRWCCGPGQTGSDLPCWAPWQLQSLKCHTHRHTCKRPQPWEEDNVPKTGFWRGDHLIHLQGRLLSQSYSKTFVIFRRKQHKTIWLQFSIILNIPHWPDGGPVLPCTLHTQPSVTTPATILKQLAVRRHPEHGHGFGRVQTRLQHNRQIVAADTRRGFYIHREWECSAEATDLSPATK